MVKLDEVKSWKNRFQEKLVDITEFQDFENVLNDERLKTFMNTTLKELIPKVNELGFSYKYLWGEIPEEEKNLSMKEYLKNYYKNKFFLVEGGRLKFYISESKEIEGMIFYSLSRPAFNGGLSYVSSISFFSFNLNSNMLTLIRDMYSLIKDLLKKYASVNWSADIENPACEKYKEICRKLGGDYFVDRSNPGIIYFEIEGNYHYEYSSTKLSEKLRIFRERGISDLDKELLNE